jgi:outer membrane protein assembly factor BamB
MSNESQTHEPYRATEQPADEKAVRRPNRWVRGLIAFAIGAAAITALQVTATDADHQNANMASMAIGLLSAIVVIYQLQRGFAGLGHRFVVPAVVGLGLLGFFTVFELDGVSGEIMPQFRNRFQERLARKTINPDASARTDTAGTPATGDAADPTVFTSVSSRGFLGSDRTSKLGDRQFTVPSDPSGLRTVWNQGIGEGWASFAVADGLAVTIEQREDQECVTCYRLADGELVWIVQHEALHSDSAGGIGPRSTPIIEGDRVFVQGATGTLWCLELASGDIVWQVDLLSLAGWTQEESELSIQWGRAGSPLLTAGLCIVPFGAPDDESAEGRSLIALDPETGEVKWKAGEYQVSYASPALVEVDGEAQIVSVNSGAISGHRIEDGAVLWDFPWSGEANWYPSCAAAVAVGNNQFLVGKGYGGGSVLVEIEKNEAGEFSADAVWESPRVLKTKFNHPCVVDGVAYAISNGSFEAVRIEDGKQLWRQPRRSRFGQGQVLLAGDVFVAQSESGDVVFVALDENEYRELLRVPALTSKTWNIPTLAGRLLLVRNDRQVICYELPELQ